MSFISSGATHRNYNILLGNGSGNGPSGCTDGPLWTLIAGLPGSYNYASAGTDGRLSVAYNSDTLQFVLAGNNAGQPGILWSDDLGATWNVATVPTPGAGAFSISSDDNSGAMICGCNAITILRSLDGGVFWQTRPVAFGAYLNTSFAQGNFYLVGASYIAQSVNNGFSFSLVYSGVSTNNSNVASDENGTLVVLGHDTVSAGFVVISTDNGATWTQSAVPVPWNNTNCPQFVIFANNTFWASGTGGSLSDNLYYSTDGVNWLTTQLVGTGIATNFWSNIVFADNQYLVASRNSQDVSRSSDGINWSLSTNPMIVGGAASMAVNNNRNYVAQRNPGANISDVRTGVC